jgi:hypothetical protein
MSHFLQGVAFLHPANLSVTPPAFEMGIPKNMCMLISYHIHIFISLWQFDRTIFEGVFD